MFCKLTEYVSPGMMMKFVFFYCNFALEEWVLWPAHATVYILVIMLKTYEFTKGVHIVRIFFFIFSVGDRMLILVIFKLSDK